jgi:hypothetical protein
MAKGEAANSLHPSRHAGHMQLHVRAQGRVELEARWGGGARMRGAAGPDSGEAECD